MVYERRGQPRQSGSELGIDLVVEEGQGQTRLVLQVFKHPCMGLVVSSLGQGQA